MLPSAWLFYLILSLLAVSGLAVSSSVAQLTPPSIATIIGARCPALSPDGQQIAFVYRGDVWTASIKGGHATPLTQHLAMDSYPLYSPDGKWIAFSSRRNGNWDIFISPAEGGAPRQMTWHSGTEIAYGWSPDGKSLLFSSKRDTPNYTLYALDVNTLRCEKLTEDYASINFPNYSPDGQKVVYGRGGFHWTRPRYSGSGAAQISLLDLSNGARRAVTSDERQHLWTKFMPDGKRVVTVTVGELTPSVSRLGEVNSKFMDNPLRTPNLWLFDLDGKGQPLTKFVGGGVRSPSVAFKSGDIAFEYSSNLWCLKAGVTEPVKLEFYGAIDEKQNSRRSEKLVNGVAEAEPSPDGKTFAFGVKGDIWTVQVEKPKGIEGRGSDIAKRLTDWAGDDSDFCWSDNGKKLFFTSDREFNQRLYELTLEDMKLRSLWNREDNVLRLQLSPDGKKLAFWVTGKEGGLYILTLETGDTKRLVQLPGSHSNGYGGGDFSWSPDQQWIAYSRRGVNLAWNIYIVPVAGGEAVNITRLNAAHSQPTWSPDGKYLFFQSNRDGDGLYILPLLPETVRSADTELKFEKPKDKETVKVDIDFTNLTRRIRRHVSQNPQADLMVTSEGLIVFISEGDIWSVTYDGKETKRLTTGGGKSALRVNKDGKRGFAVLNGELQQFKLPDAKLEKVTFTADWERDVRAERLASFTQFWRTFQRSFYDPNFHGRDWVEIRKRYEPLLNSIETNEEFAALLHSMVGELESSHSEITPAASGLPEPVTPLLGFTFDYTYKGPGIKVAKVPEGAPGSYAKTQIKEGDYIMAINGRDVALDEKLYQYINDKQDREFEFLVKSDPAKTNSHAVKYKVMTPDEWSSLNYRNRTERLRKYVEDKSKGKIGYLHLSAMEANNQTLFEREVYEYIEGKDAMIFDVRFNNGGNISDTLIEWLVRKQHGFSRPRDSDPEPAPSRAWSKPIIVLINELSFSNGEMFPYAMRQRGLAKLVGMPTPGYVIWTWGFRLVDGTGARMPATGVYRLDGTSQENIGEQPDVKIPLSPEEWLTDRDPQLDKAIEMLKP